MNGSPKLDLKVDWCSYKAAKYAVEKWHYSGRMPKFRLVKIGVWGTGKFIGVILFGDSITPYLSNAYGLNAMEVTELVRIALDTHRHPVSQIAMRGMRLLHKANPGLRLIVSYADPSHWHNGAIYQAMNWIYSGESARITQYYWRGQWRNDSPMFRYFKTHKKEKEACETRKLQAKHKYLYPLDKAIRRQIEKLRQPYPKRTASGGTSDPTGVGGSTPTRPLQKAHVC